MLIISKPEDVNGESDKDFWKSVLETDEPLGIFAVAGAAATQLQSVEKGGKGSGHFGHRGRPGQIGGSVGGIPTSLGESTKIYSLDEIKSEDQEALAKAREYYAQQTLAIGGNFMNPVNIVQWDRVPGGWNTYHPKAIHNFKVYLSKISGVLYGNISDELAARYGRGLLTTDEAVLDAKRQRKTAKLRFKGGKLAEDNVVPEFIPFEPEIVTKKAKLRLKGGAGSGFHNHAGRPGEIGGSASRGTVKDTSYYEERDAVGEYWSRLNSFLQGWAVADEKDSNVTAIQAAASRAFGVSQEENFVYERFMERVRVDPAQFEQAIKNLYDYTQSKLAKDYPEGYIEVYRALHNVYDYEQFPTSGEVDLNDDILSSWSRTPEGAKQAIEYWGTKQSYRLVKTRIPTKDILMYPGSTWAMRRQVGEEEFVTINRAPRKAEVIESALDKRDKS
jgi:hypothetical protein